MNTKDENKQQEIHEEKLRTDIEYATQWLMDSIYDDLPSFEMFVEDYQMFPNISREFLRALTNINNANKPIVDIDCIELAGASQDEIQIISARNLTIKNSKHAVCEAITRIKDEFDSKIKLIIEGKHA